VAEVRVKRVYDAPSDGDGVRVLVDRLWPRGLTKKEAKLDAWLRDLAPSNELRKWIHAHSGHWRDFRERYVRELGGPSAAADLHQVGEFLGTGRPVTLLFASKNREQNNATVLREWLLGTKKQAREKPASKEPSRQRRRST
jgi:uncharacterized protein YeaO (DUF488 family)